MSSNIKEQYARIQGALDDENLWQALETGWMVATGHVRKDGQWVRERASNGQLCRGFAVDAETGQTLEGSSHHHNGAWEILTEEVGKSIRDLLAAEARVLNGRMMRIDGFDFPIVQLFFPPVSAPEELEPIESVEAGLLEKGYLSISLVLMRRNLREAEKFRLKRGRKSRTGGSG